jgi:hypothetical protein
MVMVNYKIYADIRFDIDKVHRLKFCSLNEIYLNYSTRNVIGLELINQNWSELPNDIKLFNKLEYIDITNNKNIKYFPKVLYKLRKLHSIKANKNNFIFDEDDVIYINHLHRFYYDNKQSS